jgi:RNA polymerase sigma factor (sigma-70 family)
MDEHTLYTSLLKGSNIGSLPFADSLASIYSDMIERGSLQNFTAIFPNLIYYYGDMMEESEEQEIERILQKTDRQIISQKLRKLEGNYGEYFLELISERRETVERIYQDITQRTNKVMADKDIIAIKKAESMADPVEAGRIWKAIVKNENSAIHFLYQNTIGQIKHHILQNNGDEDDAHDNWHKTQLEFTKKLKKVPNDEGYYEWRPTTSSSTESTSIQTFFYKISKMRWLDFLRSRKREEEVYKDALIHKNDEVSATEEYESREANDMLRLKLEKAITKLENRCPEILMGKWFGGQYGDGLTTKELSQQINLAVGTIDNRHRGCLEDLKAILR